MHIAENPAFRFPSRARCAPGLRWAVLLLAAMSGSLFAAESPGARSGSGRLTVTTQPAGASIYLDGQASGKSPKEIQGLGPGRYYVRIELEGYRPAESVVELSSAQNFRALEVEMISVNAPRSVEPAPAPAPAVPIAVSRPAPPVTTPPPATPAPIAVVAPPPRATPAPAPVRPVATPPTAPASIPAAAPSADVDETILRLVAAHLKSISDGDVDTYLRLCASKVDLYDEGMQTRDAIRKSRQKLKERWPVYEISNVREVTVQPTDRPDVRRAAVTYDWNVSNPTTGKKASGYASDLLDFKQTGGQWLIVKARQNVDRSKK